MKGAGMPQEYWLETLYSLLARFSELAVEVDPSSMTEGDLRGLLRFLQRKAQSE